MEHGNGTASNAASSTTDVATNNTANGRLGFGLMRLPRRGVKIDVEQVAQMVDLFLEAGFTYFDTARVYPGSETATREALVKRYPRDSFTIATKMNTMIAPTARLARRQVDTSMRKLGVSYIDHYLLHNLTNGTHKSYENMGLWDFVRDLKREGKVRHYGFSFHAGPDLLNQLLKDHPDVDFVQLQLNYADWENPRVQSRANYEVARAHNVPIVVMEPVKGGTLANPPANVKALFKKADPQASPASWAIRFAASLDGVITVLSGMSNLEQLRDNVSYMRGFQPLSPDEMLVIRQAQELMGAASRIGCTACGYCLEGCPQQIPIPEVFAAMNERLDGHLEAAQARYEAAVAGAGRASDCIACAACEQICTQNLPIIEHLEECARAFD